VAGLAVVGLALAVVGTLAVSYAAKLLRDFNHAGPVSTTVAAVLVIVSLYAWWPALRAFGSARQRAALLANDELVAARRVSAAGRELALIAMGYAAASLVVALTLVFVLANNGGVATTFFALDPIHQSFHQVLQGFWTNVWVACVAEVLVLILGLLVAIVRMLPGKAGAPLRGLAVVFADVFRGIPAIIVIILVGFGLPLTGVHQLQHLPLTMLGVIALTLTYTAYVSEVYRAGLAFGYTQTLRTVLVPQAVRRVVPPLLNDFIGLQKDTALLSTLAIGESLNNAKLWEANLFNLSPILLAALFFVLITIPQARLVDFLIERDASRRAGK
jgi:polar amino acid transport system permease protein